MTIPRIPDYPLPRSDEYPVAKVKWQIEPARAVLLIHDMQRYFLRFYDRNGPLLGTVIHNIQRLRDWADAQGVPVVYTAQPHQQPAGDRALLNDMWGPGLPAADAAEQPIIDELTPRAHDTVQDKWRYSAFQRSDLKERMRAQRRDQLIICGVYAHIGCMMTAVDAFMNDIQPFLVGDALADFSEQKHRMALEYVATTAGQVLGTEGVLARGQTAQGS